MGPASGDDTPLPLRELARRAGVSDGTLRNWEKLPDHPLAVKRIGRRSATSTVAALRAFCAVHGELPAARAALARLTDPLATLDVAALRDVMAVVVTTVRAATAAQVELAQAGAGLGEGAAARSRAHAEALSSLLTQLDNALARIGSPPTHA